MDDYGAGYGDGLIFIAAAVMIGIGSLLDRYWPFGLKLWTGACLGLILTYGIGVWAYIFAGWGMSLYRLVRHIPG